MQIYVIKLKMKNKTIFEIKMNQKQLLKQTEKDIICLYVCFLFRFFNFILYYNLLPLDALF